MKRLLKNESGASAIIVALVMTLILTASALALDIGAAYVEASNTQNAADAIALSVGRYLPVDENDSLKINIVLNAASEYAQKNEVENFYPENVIFGDVKDGKFTSVTISVSKTSETRLAKIIGVDNIEILKSATVSARPVGSITGAVPLGITEEAYNNVISTGEDHVIIKVGGGDGDTGFYGFVVLDDSNGNAALLEKWLKYGYEGENYVGQSLPVATGNKTSAARDAVEYRLSLCNHYVGYGGCIIDHYVEDCPRVMYILIYSFTDSRTVQIVGFAPFLLEGSPSDDEIQGSFIYTNISYTDRISEKDFGIYTYRLTK
ncbi:MAG: hypothetical protein A2Y17_10605 [Clostridiales bacterium GWF2_38_85]|nr:MAG: hypothetical protein A2Y17_10605 [Clostridiales bacterium GWF2_38_85]HBL83479.1 hypothetical protein [Clostridiales bacterium]